MLRRVVRSAAGPPAADPPPVIFVLSTAWAVGGTIRATLDLAGYLARRRDVIVVSAGRWKDDPFFTFPPGVRVVDLVDHRPGARRRGLLDPLLGRLPSVLVPAPERASRGFRLRSDVALARFLRGRTGIVIGTRPGYNVALARLRAPRLAVVAQEHMHLTRHRPALQREMERAYRDVAAIVTLTEGDRRRYSDRLGGARRVVALPNVTRLTEQHADLEASRVLAAGRLTRQKGFDLLIEAFASVAGRHPGWSLDICGNGPLAAPLREQADREGGASIMIRPAARDLAAEMRSASIFVLSSRWEGMPKTLLEAMATGMAVVAFDCPTGPAELISDRRNGILVPHGDVAALAAAIDELIADPQLRRHCAAGAIATAREHSPERIGALWDALLDDVWAAHSGRRLRREQPSA